MYHDKERCMQVDNPLSNSHGQTSVAGVRSSYSVSKLETIQHRKQDLVSLINLFYEPTK